jgi:hypothetical protein
MPAAGLAAAALWLVLGAHASGTPALTASVTPAELPYGAGFSVSGQASAAGVPLTVEADPYPFGAWKAVAKGASASDGSYTIAAPATRRALN